MHLRYLRACSVPERRIRSPTGNAEAGPDTTPTATPSMRAAAGRSGTRAGSLRGRGSRPILLLSTLAEPSQAHTPAPVNVTPRTEAIATVSVTPAPCTAAPNSAAVGT
ncbi:MAG: hypothetical protein M3281_00375, partial [Chloroflexota bacterium]|nr:hypothetical protein [Chloroflexota bacterium]